MGNLIEPTFEYHKPSQTGIKKIESIRLGFSNLLRELNAIMPNDSRHKSMCITHLETAAMFATKNVVFTDPESEVA